MKSPLSSSSAPEVANDVVTTAVKIFDRLDLFEQDGLVASIPFGKAVQAVWKLARKISKPEDAIRHSVGSAVGMCFGMALQRAGIKNLGLIDRDKRQQKSRLELAFEKEEVDVLSFDPSYLNTAPIAVEFFKLYEKSFDLSDAKGNSGDKEITRQEIRNYLDDWLIIYWHRLVEKRQDKYGPLTDYLSRESFILERKKRSLLLYREALSSMYLDAVQNHKDIQLSDLYIMPDCEVLEKICKDGRESHVGHSKFVDPKIANFPDDLHSLTNTWLKGDLPLNGIRGSDHRFLLLYGAPGQGKTSFCKRLLNDLHSQYPITRRPFYFLRLRRVKDPGRIHLEYLKEEIERVYGIEIPDTEFKQAVIILDGMDELAMSGSLTIESADQIIRTLQDELREEPDVHLVVTSRHGYIRNDQELRKAIILQLKNTSLEKRDKWIQCYCHLRILNEEWEKDLLSVRPGSPLGELMTQPLLLQMVADTQKLPSNNAARAEVYQLLFNNLINAIWKEEGKVVPILDGLNEDEASQYFRYSLQEIAFTMFKNGKGYLTTDEFEKLHYVRELQEILGNKDRVTEIYRLIYVSFYFREVGMATGEVKAKTEDYAIEFMHKSFGEFLAVEYFYREIMETLLDRKGRSFRVSGDDFVNTWGNLAAARPFSREMINYLVDLVKLDNTKPKKDSLKERLLEYFPLLYQAGFLPIHPNQKMSHNLIERGIESFYLWLTLCSRLNSATLLIQKWDYGTEMLKWLLVSNRNIFLPKSDLSRADLTGTDLTEADLTGANLSGANLTGANLIVAKLEGTNLEDAGLEGANLVGTNLKEAELRKAELDGADLKGANLSGANLTGAYLNGANLSGANLTEAKLTKANINGANLEEADFKEANLEGAKLSGAKLLRSNLNEANLEGAKLNRADLGYAYLSGAKLSGAKLIRSNLNEANLNGADLTAADLTGADLEGTNLIGADLTAANLRGASLKGTILFGVILNEADLTGAELKKADLGAADLTGADLTGADLEGANLIGADLTGAKLNRADLGYADLSGAKLNGAELNGAKLKEASLGGADLTGAKLNRADINGADLGYADLSGAKLNGADLGYADLSRAKLTGADLTGAVTINTIWTNAITTDVIGLNLRDKTVKE